MANVYVYVLYLLIRFEIDFGSVLKYAATALNNVQNQNQNQVEKRSSLNHTHTRIYAHTHSLTHTLSVCIYSIFTDSNNATLLCVVCVAFFEYFIWLSCRRCITILPSLSSFKPKLNTVIPKCMHIHVCVTVCCFILLRAFQKRQRQRQLHKRYKKNTKNKTNVWTRMYIY